MSVVFFKTKYKNDEPSAKSWSNQDIADFYRAVEILKQAGLDTEVDSGTTDEGDPWFVFMKPENGDVIAHFAHIDGSFVAVSSLNQQVYKGKNIRTIIDQMVDRHPMLLPQNKNGGKLFLHPTAALTAFLAAAFILTIDGVKAKSIDDVIVVAGSQNFTNQIISNQGLTVENKFKLDSLKTIFSDLNSHNYNVAVLGAALIAHELSQSDFAESQQSELDLYSVGSDGEQLEAAVPVDEYIVLSVDNKQHPTNSGSRDKSIRNIDEENHDGEKDQPNSKEGLNKVEAQDLSSHEAAFDMSFSEGSADAVTSVPIDYDIFRDASHLVSHANYKSVNKGKITNNTDEFDLAVQSEASGQLENTAEVEIGGALEVSGQLGFNGSEGNIETSLADLVENFQLVFQNNYMGYDSEAILGLDGLVVTFDTSGELKVVSLDNLSLEPDSQKEKEALPLVEINPEFHVGPITSESEQDDQYSNEKQSLEVQAQPLLESRPILGHSLNPEGEFLELSEAIDVVFYEGGNAEISEFELGTDLLWFFLSPDELATARNSVNEDGDLVLDFGDTGTLTFLGMVTETVYDVIV